MTVLYCHIESPVGPLLLAGERNALHAIEFPQGGLPRPPRSEWKEDRAAFRDVERQLGDYFAGRLQEFDLQLEPAGTPFQLRVWQALREIPYGETTSYGALAREIGRPNAFRAVGAANGRNPLSIVVPCHRVIGSNGALTGFGGGIPVKRALLDLEQRVACGAGGQPALGF